MGQKKGSKPKKNAVATVEGGKRQSKSTVTTLRPENKSTKSSTKTKSKTSARPSHEQIAERAHELWLKNGGKHGEDQQHWLEAEAQLEQEMGAK